MKWFQVPKKHTMSSALPGISILHQEVRINQIFHMSTQNMLIWFGIMELFQLTKNKWYNIIIPFLAPVSYTKKYKTCFSWVHIHSERRGGIATAPPLRRSYSDRTVTSPGGAFQTDTNLANHRHRTRLLADCQWRCRWRCGLGRLRNTRSLTKTIPRDRRKLIKLMLRNWTFLPPRSHLIRQFVKRHLVTLRREQHVLAQWLRQYFCQDHCVRSVEYTEHGELVWQHGISSNNQKICNAIVISPSWRQYLTPKSIKCMFHMSTSLASWNYFESLKEGYNANISSRHQYFTLRRMTHMFYTSTQN